MSIKPDWNEVASRIGDNLTKDELNVAWTIECNNWLDAICKEYGENYHIYESKNFLLLSNESDRYDL